MKLLDYTPPDQVLSDRTILVSGAGQGIGRAVSLALADFGATVILLDKSLPDIEAVYDEIENNGNPTPALYPMNLESATENDYELLRNVIKKEFGKLDGLLHNAAELPYLSRIDDYELSDWNKVMQVNITAAFLLSRACLPVLRQSDDASIVFNSDNAGRKGKAYWGAYGVSKFALEGLMQTLAEETEENSPIRVNSLDPGAVRTKLRANVFPGENPLKLPAAEEITQAWVYLLGPDSQGMSGQALSL
ncbi:MAG: YciK family oxidoreductase [gamma proteobacterium symbiont of Bathyaustriella thionipta]|nr:YciK family oxidoreductase [gamma proteobacterium symbiont of Bathyaustriella thionipta]